MATAKTNLGRVGLYPRGEYSPAETYRRLDFITHEGSAYVSLVDDLTDVVPGTDPAKWQLLAVRGDVGPQGNKGDEGQQGEKGEKGNGIVSVTLNDDYTLTITFDEGEPYTSGSIRGEKGETGEPGADGKDGDTGPQGEQGERGVGIKSVKLNEDYTLTVTLEDEQEFTTESIRGATGPIGPANIIKGEAYESLEALQAAVLSPAEGDQYNVGSEPPYDVYRWTGGKWENQGKVQGPQGPQGDTGAEGKPGTTFTPAVSEDGVLSWTNDGEKENPQDVNIKGPQGDVGETGAPGEPGKPPKIGDDGMWQVWDNESGEYQSTDVPAQCAAITPVSVPAEGWNDGDESTLPHIEVTAPGVLPTNANIADINQTGAKDADAQVRDAWAQVTRIVAETDKLTVYAEKTPDVAIPLNLIAILGVPGQEHATASDVLIVRRGVVGGAKPANSIELAEVKLVENHFIYDGGEKTQEVESVTFNGEPLILGTDYFVTGKTATTAGKHYIEILGIRNYSGVKQVEWTIEKAQSTISVDPNEITYSGDIGTVKTATISHTGDGEITTESNTPLVATATVEGATLKVTCHMAGSAKITVKIAETLNYKGASCDVDVSGTQLEGSLSLEKSDLTVKGVMGTTGTVKITHTGDGEITAQSDEEGTATAKVEGDTLTITSVKAGSTRVTVTMAETPNYKGASAELTVIVEKADASVSLNSSMLTITGVMGTTGTMQFSHTGNGAVTVESLTPAIATATFDADTITVKSVKEGQATISVRTEETDDYSAASAELSVTVKRATGSISVEPSSVDLTGDQGTQATATLTHTGDGEISISAAQYVQVSRAGDKITLTSIAEGSESLTITLSETENYTGASCTINVSVKFRAPVSDTLEENDWATIAEVAASGEASQHWQIGDTKTITIGSETYHAQIIGFNHDDLDSSDAKYNDASYNGGTKKAGITFQMQEILTQLYRMDETSSNACSWRDSEMRVQTMPAIKQIFDAEAVAVMRTVAKKTAHSQSDSTIFTTPDELFLLAHIEVFESVGSSHPGEGEQYEFYKSGNSKIKYYLSGSAYIWWLRSPSTNYATNFRAVSSSGYANNSTATDTRGVAAGFCV